MVEQKDSNRIINEFKRQGKNCVAVCSTDKKSIAKLKSAIFNLFEDVLQRNKGKGVFKAIRLMVAGIPNTGKSTLINALVGFKKAITGDKAGVTRTGQWAKLEDLELFDTPGTMPPSFENQTNARHLAYIGCVNDDILDFPDLTLELLKELQQTHPQLLMARYNLPSVEMEGLELYEAICQKRGFIMKGKEFDYDRCANAVIDDLRKCRIGKICFE